MTGKSLVNEKHHGTELNFPLNQVICVAECTMNLKRLLVVSLHLGRQHLERHFRLAPETSQTSSTTKSQKVNIFCLLSDIVPANIQNKSWIKIERL